jgi:hypothetical protein
MYAVIDRYNMTLVCTYADQWSAMEAHSKLPFVKLDLSDENAFRTFTLLELKLLYRNTGMVMGTILGDRESMLKAVARLCKAKPCGNPAQQTLFNPAPAHSLPHASAPRTAVAAKVQAPANDAQNSPVGTSFLIKPMEGIKRPWEV